VNLHQLIRSRRTVAAFAPKPVDPALVEELLESAVYAPNHRMTQPWRFVFVQGKGVERYARMRAEMVETSNYQATFEKFANVPFYLIVVNKVSPNAEVAEEDALAAAALVQNFLLLAQDAGLGTAWKTFKPDPRLREFAGIAEDEHVIAIVHVGYSAEEPRPGIRKRAQERIAVIE
jgi:nitroreductase